MFGADAYAVTELDGGIKTYKSTGASKADPLNQVDAYGWKINMACKVINPSAIEILWSSQDEIVRNTTQLFGTGASGASALGINCLVPSGKTELGTYFGTIMQSW